MWKAVEEEKRSLFFVGNEFLREEEYADACRLSLQKTKAGHCALICALYGVMVHTVFCRPDESDALFEAMKKDVEALLALEGSEKEKEVQAFVARYGTDFACLGGEQ